jgi:hypothetical protein
MNKKRNGDMNIKSLLATASAGVLALSLAATEANSAAVTLADYSVTPSPGDSWTYRVNMDSTIYLSGGDVFFPAGAEFTVTEQWDFTPLPDVVETGVAILFESPNISVYLDIIPTLTVSAGTFINVLQMAWLDSNFAANSMNIALGIDPSINEGVTDVNWYAPGVGEIKGLGVGALDGSLDADWDLISYAISYTAPGWSVSDFLTLSSPTKSIAFDSINNLYIEDISDNNSGTIKILKLDVASGYNAPPSEFILYATSYKGVNGLGFDGLGSLYVSESSLSGDAGVIREIDVTTQTLLGDVMTFANHRPTGVDADKSGNVFYTGRKESDGTFGNVYQIDSMGVRSILIDNVVGTGIAVDASGNIFISTPGRTDLALLSNSIYMFSPSDLLNPTRIATFDDTLEELTFDDAGNLYAVDNINRFNIIKLSPNDTDSDGILDYMDNCTLVSNASQLDTDNDGFGNICDPDFNNDGVVASADLAFFKPKFFSTDPDADLNGDGVVNAGDLKILKLFFFKPPGPSGLVP